MNDTESPFFFLSRAPTHPTPTLIFTPLMPGGNKKVTYT